jgi:hypothetical protein
MKEQDIEELLNPQRFMYVYNFIHMFRHKLEETRDSRIEQLHISLDMLSALQNTRDVNPELNDEVATGDRLFPRGVVRVLRRLQEQLHIGADEFAYHKEQVTSRLHAPLDVLNEFNKRSIDVQTDYIKMLDFNAQVRIDSPLQLADENNWRSAFLLHTLKGVAPLSALATVDTLERIAYNKLRAELAGMSSQCRV